MLIPLLLLLQLQAPTILDRPLRTRNEIRDSSVNFIVLHYDDADSYAIARATLVKRNLSYHYYIRRDGIIVKFVDPKYVASHVGISYFRGYVRLNKYSIGICLQNNSQQAYTTEQYQSLGYLIHQLRQRYPDSTSRVIVGHSDVAMPFGRKHDPGPMFDWLTLRQQLIRYERQTDTIRRN